MKHKDCRYFSHKIFKDDESKWRASPYCRKISSVIVRCPIECINYHRKKKEDHYIQVPSI